MFDGRCQAGVCARIGEKICSTLKVLVLDLKVMFETMGMQWWLYGGALIGAGRHGTLESDDDMDIGVLIEGDRIKQWPDIRDRIVQVFASHGHESKPKSDVVMYFEHKNGAHTDLHAYFWDYHANLLVLQDDNHLPYLEAAKWVFPLKQCRVYDMSVPCPNQAAKYMYMLHSAEYYGVCILVSATGEMGEFTIKPCARTSTYTGSVVSTQRRLHEFGYASFMPLVKSYEESKYMDCEQEIPDIEVL